MLEQVRYDPAYPIQWGKNQPGMQANGTLDQAYATQAKIEWFEASRHAADSAEKMMQLGLAKEVANRILEPFQWIHVVMTTTELDNFFELRNHPDAQPEIHQLAALMLHAYEESKPQVLKEGEWHLPYITKEELADSFFKQPENQDKLLKMSAARCCRVSYLKHDGQVPSIADDLALANRLAGSVPIHASPFEHPAMCVEDDKFFFNHRGWQSYRWFYEKNVVPHLERR
jgi:thymidylate synthase ThyX